MYCKISETIIIGNLSKSQRIKVFESCTTIAKCEKKLFFVFLVGSMLWTWKKEMTSSRGSMWEPQTKALLVSLASMATWPVTLVLEVCCTSVALLLEVFLLSQISFPEKTTYPNKSDFSSPPAAAAEAAGPPSPTSILCSKLLGLTGSSAGVGILERLLVMVVVVVVWLDCLHFSGKTIGKEFWSLVAICEHKPKWRWGVITLKGEVVLILLLVLVFLGRLPLFYISISIST